MGKRKIEGLTAQEFEHPFDKQALDTLKEVPGLDTLLKWMWKNGIEKTLQYQYLSSSLRVTAENLPDIYSVFEEAKDTLDLTKNVSLYINSEVSLDAGTIGAEQHFILLSSGLVNMCSQAQLQYIIGHEMGHIMAGHTLYTQAASLVSLAAEYLANVTFGISGLVSQGLNMALLHWSRMAEFTSDRAGLLACQDYKAAQETNMLLAGFPDGNISDQQRSEWVKQCKEFQNIDYAFLAKTISLLGGGGIASQVYNTHPYSVLRSAQIMEWIETGGYGDVISRKTQVYSPKDNGSFCGQCGGKLFGNESFCPVCGQPIKQNMPIEDSSTPKCLKCGFKIEPDSVFCSNCGNKCGLNEIL